MKNNEILVLADLHANVWLRQSPEPDYRMNQMLTLADRVAQEMQRRDTEHLAIAGDLIDSWNVEPKVIKTLFGFFSRLITAIPSIKIYFIVGQHDLLRYDDYTTANSYIYEALDIFPENVFYMHDKSLCINNTTIYFSNFSRNKDDTKLNYPPVYHDIWISHVTLGFGHVVDSPNYSLGVFGDIHDYVDDGKNHSVMTPYQHYPHQPKDGKIGVIELKGKDSRFYRINSDDPEHGFEFLKLKMNVAEEEKEKEALPELKIEKFDATNVNRLIEEEVSKHGLAHIHSEAAKAEMPMPVNFNFQLKRLEIDNFRSVKHLEVDFSRLGAITYIQGDNGSGKSTIFNAITTAFVGDKKLLEQKNNRAGKKDEVRIQLWLEYEGREFYLDRWGKNNLRFKAGEELIELGKRQQQKELEKYLPFLGYFQYFYIRPNSHYWESMDKEQFMKVLFNLNVFDSLVSESKRLVKERNREIKAAKLKAAEIDGKIASFRETAAGYEKELEEIGTVLDLEWIEKMAKEENEAYVKTKSAYERHLAAKSRLELPMPVAPETQKADAEAEIQRLEKSIRDAEQINSNAAALQAKSAALLNEISNMKKRSVVCPNCGHTVSGASKEDIDRMQETYEKTRAEAAAAAGQRVSTAELSRQLSKSREVIAAWVKYQKDIESRNKDAERVQVTETEYNEAKEILVKKCQEIGGFHKHAECVEFLSKEKERAVRHRSVSVHLDQAEDSIKKLEPEKDALIKKTAELEKEVGEFEKYISLFDVSTVNSIPNTILNKLVSHLNTDMIKFESMKVDEDEEQEFEINVSINVDGQWISYEHASTGQKILMDQFILIRVTSFLGGSGLIMMDEPYTNLDAEKLEEAVKLLQEIKSSRILITSHTSLFANYDSIIRVRRTDGVTEVNV